MLLKKIFIILCLSFLWSSAAQAKIPAIFNTGDELFEIGDFPKESIQAFGDLKDLKAAYKCKHFGLFWADVWTWDCSLVATSSAEANTYYDLPADLTAALQNNKDYQTSAMKRSFWNHYGIFIMILLIVGYFGFGYLSKSKE